MEVTQQASSGSAGKITYDPSKHDVLTTQLQEIEQSFSAVSTCLEKTSGTLSGTIKGEAADQLIETISALVSDFSKEKENWTTVIDNAKKMEQKLISMDDSLSQFVNKTNE